MSQFINETVVHLKQKFPVSIVNITDQDLHKLIKEGIEKAAGYNIVERDDVLPFIEYMISLGKDFDREEDNRWAYEILVMDDIEGTDKIALLISKKPLYPA